MALTERYLQEVIASKDQDLALQEATAAQTVVGWAICDRALVIYDVEDPPAWFRFERDEDGNSTENPRQDESPGLRDSLTVPGR
jgi:hypothetical protein